MACLETVRSRAVTLGAGLVVAVVLGLFPSLSQAGSDYGDKDFAVRLAPSFLRFTEVSSMGGETAANRWSSAINPASAGWLEIPETFGVVFAPYYSNVGFTGGMNIHVMGESLTWDTKGCGTFQPTFAQIRSSGGKTNQGLEFGYKVDTAQLQWAKRWGDWAFGANFNFASAKIHQDGVFVTPGALPVTTRVSSEGNAESYRFRIGGLRKFADKFLAGLVLEYGFQPYRSHTMSISTIPAPVPPTVTIMKDRGTQQQYIIRPAISWEYGDMSTLSADYQYGGFFNKDDCLQSHRWTVSLQHRVKEWLFLRGSGSIDQRGNMGASAGLSMFVAKNAGFFVGYQYNMLPELTPEFGRAHTLQMGINIRF